MPGWRGGVFDQGCARREAADHRSHPKVLSGWVLPHLHNGRDRPFAKVCMCVCVCMFLTQRTVFDVTRDVTPEAMEEVCDKILPGFGELMRRVSVDQGYARSTAEEINLISPLRVLTAILSRQTAGTVGSSFVINLPGKPDAIRTCLGAVLPATPHVTLPTHSC